MIPKPLVSVIVTNYNYERYLSEAIQSALDQTYGSYEVIVVDDGSTDHSKSVIASFGHDIVPVLQENRGQASAFNAGIEISRGSLVCLLDADDVWRRDKLAIVVDQSHESDALVYHQVQEVDADLHPRGRPGPREGYDGTLRDRALRSGGWWPFPPTSALSFSRSYLDRVSPVPLAYRLCADAYLAGLAPHAGTVRGVLEPLALYRIHGQNGWTRNGLDAKTIVRRRLAQYEFQVRTLNESLVRLELGGQVRLVDHWPHRMLTSQLTGKFTVRDCLDGLRFPVLKPRLRATSTLRTSWSVLQHCAAVRRGRP